MKEQFIVTVNMPETISIQEMGNYIRDAVKTWKGSMNPEGELFNMESDEFTVKHIK